MRPELLIVDGEIVAVRLAGQEFPCEPEGVEAIIPKSVLKGFRLSEIPEELTIKPVESVAEGRVEIKDDIQLSSFADGSASALIEVVLRRKHWDGDVGLTPYIEAYRQAIRERNDAEETGFQDDGDFIFLHYEITISRDMEIQDAISNVESIISSVEDRTEQIAHRREDALTSIFDRGTFDADSAHAVDSPQAIPLSLLIIDLDKFKTINDTYGHEAGDEVLVKVANVLRLACGDKGSCYRYGGDEMTMLLPKHDLWQATAIAEQMREESAKGEELGLSEDEVAFYDALEVNDSAVKVLGEPTLKTIARELVDTVRRNTTIDWTVRENIRANLRVLVKRILRKYGYPPDKQEKATLTVLEQAEVLSANWATV